MRRTPLAIAAASMLAAAALPATASADVQIGVTSTPVVAPTCPAGTTAADCTILLTEMTGMETLSDGIASPDTIKATGVLSAFYVGVSSAAAKYAAGASGLNATYGGPPEAEITVLRPVGAGTTKRYVVAATGPLENLTAYQGDVVEFPLPQELPVVKGEVVALTSPTWAPVLSIGLTTSFSYIQSRTGNCAGAQGKGTYYDPQTVVGDQSAYGCAYSKTRVEYSATEITTPSVAVAYRMAGRTSKVTRPRIIKR